MPKVSIIVPVYNVATYLPKCVESILNQTESDIEIILVNDGSTDNSLEICKTLASQDERIVVLDRPNGGASAARNTIDFLWLFDCVYIPLRHREILLWLKCVLPHLFRSTRVCDILWSHFGLPPFTLLYIRGNLR